MGNNNMEHACKICRSTICNHSKQDQIDYFQQSMITGYEEIDEVSILKSIIREMATVLRFFAATGDVINPNQARIAEAILETQKVCDIMERK